jgi:hypothetical protein
MARLPLAVASVAWKLLHWLEMDDQPIIRLSRLTSQIAKNIASRKSTGSPAVVLADIAVSVFGYPT